MHNHFHNRTSFDTRNTERERERERGINLSAIETIKKKALNLQNCQLSIR